MEFPDWVQVKKKQQKLYIARISIKFVFTSDEGCLFCHMKYEAYLHWHGQVDRIYYYPYAERETGGGGGGEEE